MKLKIGVIFGGQSLEHEISILTAIQAMNEIDSEKYEVVPIYVTKDLIWYTGGMLRHIDSFKEPYLIKKYAKRVNLINKNGRFILQSGNIIKHEYNEIHLALPIMHGANCEDGSIQGYLRIIGIPYIGSNNCAAAVGQDKVFMKQILESNNLPVTKYVWFNASDYYNDEEGLFKKIETLNYPLIIKPATLGSSIGIEIIKRKEELDSAIIKALNYDNKIIIEECVTDLIEYTCSVIDNKSKLFASGIEEIIIKDGIRKYDDKIISKTEKDDNFIRRNPALIPSKMAEMIEKYSIDTFKLLNHSSIATIDFLYDDKHKKLYIDEINTIPNFFAHHLWQDKNISYKELLNILISDELSKIESDSKKIKTLDSNILKNVKSKDLKELK